MHLKGQWNTQIYMRRGERGEYQLFTDVLIKPDVNKVFPSDQYKLNGQNFEGMFASDAARSPRK